MWSNGNVETLAREPVLSLAQRGDQRRARGRSNAAQAVLARMFCPPLTGIVALRPQAPSALSLSPPSKVRGDENGVPDRGEGRRVAQIELRQFVYRPALVQRGGDRIDPLGNPFTPHQLPAEQPP